MKILNDIVSDLRNRVKKFLVFNPKRYCSLWIIFIIPLFWNSRITFFSPFLTEKKKINAERRYVNGIV